MEMRGDVTDAGQPTDETLKIELLSPWKLEAESRNWIFTFVENLAFTTVLVDFVAR